MAYTKLLSTDAILNVAVQMVEQGKADGVSLRAAALALGVKAPSLYRYFPNKGALELAVAKEALRWMLIQLTSAVMLPDSKARFMGMTNAYVRFAREHYALYSYVFQGHVREAYSSSEGKALWTTMLEAVSGVTGRPDDTASTVAIWSLLHGYATLERAGGFGTSGPQGGLELGLTVFISNCDHPPPGQEARRAKPPGGGRKKR